MLRPIVVTGRRAPVGAELYDEEQCSQSEGKAPRKPKASPKDVLHVWKYKAEEEPFFYLVITSSNGHNINI